MALLYYTSWWDFDGISIKITDPAPSSTKQYRPLLTQYHQVPTSIALYWVSITDPVLSSALILALKSAKSRNN